LKNISKYLYSPKESFHRIRVQFAIVIAELLVLGLFVFWPGPENPGDDNNIIYREDELQLETPVITKQTSSPPPPPRPSLPPEPVPNDEVIEEEIEITEFNLPDVLETSELEGPGMLDSNDSSLKIHSNPQLPPNIVKIVEPVMPEEAKRNNIKAEIWVEFLVDTEGEVEEATISEIKMYNKKTDKYETVKHIDYGLIEATIKAALQWKFRPAKDNGQKVRAYTKHVFTYGG